jgi:hypothetical protein
VRKVDMITHKKSEEYTQLLKDQMDLATEKLQKLKPNYSYKKGNEEE